MADKSDGKKPDMVTPRKKQGEEPVAEVATDESGDAKSESSAKTTNK